MDSIRDKALKAQREYARKWRASHKDRVHEANRRYWEKVAMRNEGGNGNEKQKGETANG